MKKLTKKQARKLLATVGASTALAGVGVGVVAANNYMQPISIKTHAATQAQLGTDATFGKGKDIPFQIYYQVPIDSKIDKIEFYDKFETCFNYEKVQIFDDKNNDVTDQGKVDFDKATLYAKIKEIANKIGAFDNNITIATEQKTPYVYPQVKLTPKTGR